MLHSPPTKSFSSSDIKAMAEAIEQNPRSQRAEKRRKLQSEDFSELDGFKQEIKEMFASMLAEQSTRLENIEKRLFDKIESTNSDLEKTLGIMSEQLKDLQNNISHLENERKLVSTQIQMLNNKIETMERNHRKTSVEIRGVPKQQLENKSDLFNLACNLLKTLEVKYHQADLKDVYRLPVRSDTTKSTVIIELNNTLTKTSVLEAYKTFCKVYKLTSHHLGLKGEEARLFLSEHLTARDKQLLFLAKDFARNEGYMFCWVAKGRVFIRQREGAPHILIQNEETLKKLKTTN